MNKAADNIDAKSRSLRDILYEKHYKVGYFQRAYKWKRTHIEDLLIDLERSFNSNYETSHSQRDVANYSKYYMGPVVLFMDKSEYSIVDGQQRLTSFILLMIYLNDKFYEVLKTKDKLIGYIFSEHYGTKSYNLNIKTRKKILEYLYKSKNKEIDVSILNSESCKTMFERFNDIVELFPPSLLQKKVLPLFVNWLTEKLVFIEILTQTSESAYTIYETMNDRGLNLTQTELLKSFLLSNVNDEIKIKELDEIWKTKIGVFNTIDEDQDFFKAWLRAKFAVSVRLTERDSENKDFEKIGTRFSSWVQENTKFKGQDESQLLLEMDDPDSFYFFVKSDFSFFSDLYIRLKRLEISENIPEHRFKLLSYRGVSPSLSYPFILSPIQKADNEDVVEEKIGTVVRFIDSFGIYRMLLSQPITHSSIRNFIYNKIKEIRNNNLEGVIKKLNVDISRYKHDFLNIDYTKIDTNTKYILSRLYKIKNPSIQFENLYFQRKKESFALFQFLKIEDFETADMGLPKGLKDMLVDQMCSYTLVPRNQVSELDVLSFTERLKRLIKQNLIIEFPDFNEVNFDNLKDFFITREKRIKDQIINNWKVKTKSD